eukprot:scaffold34948_cov62-Phaeocystis_antarctica.AAC.1
MPRGFGALRASKSAEGRHRSEPRRLSHGGGPLHLPHCPYPRLGERKLRTRIVARTSIPRAATAQQSEHARVEAAGASP